MNSRITEVVADLAERERRREGESREAEARSCSMILMLMVVVMFKVMVVVIVIPFLNCFFNRPDFEMFFCRSREQAGVGNAEKQKIIMQVELASFPQQFACAR